MSNDTYLTLLNELNQYNFKLNQLSQCLSQGFHQLSRANYHTHNSLPFGEIYYDMNYKGQLKVNINRDEEEEIKIITQSQDNDPIKMFTGGGLIIPRQLRQSQSQFKTSITIIQDLINQRIKLINLINQLDR